MCKIYQHGNQHITLIGSAWAQSFPNIGDWTKTTQFLLVQQATHKKLGSNKSAKASCSSPCVQIKRKGPTSC